MKNRHYIIPIFVPHEGCPHDCVFCNQDSITGETEKVTGDVVRRIIKEYIKTIELNNDLSKTVEVSFFGGTFTGIDLEKQKELLSVARDYKEDGIIEYIRLSTRPDYIDETILEHLRSYKVDIIELGVQSLDEDVLQASRRGHSVEDVRKACTLIKEYGFTLGIQIMLGLPRDNMNKDIETAKEVIRLKPDIARIYPALVIKNTAMEIMCKQNIYNPYSLEECINIGKIIYAMLVSSGINVIRVGLQPTEEINEECELVTGPFHPAIRELIEGTLINDMIYYQLKDLNHLKSIIIKVNSRDVSKLYAYKKKFFGELKQKIGNISVRVEQDNNVDRNDVIVEFEQNSVKLHLMNYMKEISEEFIK